MVRGRLASYAVAALACSLLSVAAPARANPEWSEVPPPQEVVPGLRVERVMAPDVVDVSPRALARLRHRVALPTSLDVTMVQANILSRMADSTFSADLARATVSQPDFVTLNEAVRPDPLLEIDGYDHYRGYDSRWTMETTVMWRTDRWSPVSTGTRYLHRRGGLWGTRAVNWVVLEEEQTGRTVSVVSAHPSPDGPSSHGLLPVYMAGLSALVRELSVNGPVFVGGDLNAHYTSGRFPRPALTAAGLTPTYDVYGMPIGGTGDHGGATIDYLLYQPAAGVTATSQSKVELASDHDAVVGTFTWSW